MKLFRLQSRGQVLVLVALLMVVLLALAALAIDIGRAYGVKTKLNAAVDAASYEAARALAQGSGETVMKQRAEEVALNYFKANYPEAFMGAAPPVPTVTAIHDQNTGKWQVSVTATAQMPTLFAGVVGWKAVGIRAASEAVRATLDMVLVMDASNSMFDTFATVKESAKEFVGLFDQVDDRIGLVAFSTGAYPIVSICGQLQDDQDPLKQSPGRNSLSCGRGFRPEILKTAIGTGGGFGAQNTGIYMGSMTASEEGLKKALTQLNALRTADRSGRRVIVFFSDGAPNTFNGTFTLAGGGRVTKNLYSEVEDGPELQPRQMFDPGIYADYPPELRSIASLPGTDADQSVPLKGYNNKRILTGDTSPTGLKCNANAAARNMTENVADMARKDGIVIFSIGFGEDIDKRQMFDDECSTYNETGSMILKRLANTHDSDTYDSKQPSGIYCKAPDTEALKVCFEQVASAILRISK